LHHAPEAAADAGAAGVGACGAAGGAAGAGVLGLADGDGEGLGDDDESGAIDVGAEIGAAGVLLDDEHAASPAASAITPVSTAKFLMVLPP
jgi:hypothetical protein